MVVMTTVRVICIFEQVVSLAWTDSTYVKIHREVSVEFMFEMVGGFNNGALAGFRLVDVVRVSRVVCVVTQRFTDLNTARHNVHTRTCQVYKQRFTDLNTAQHNVHTRTCQVYKQRFTDLNTA